MKVRKHFPCKKDKTYQRVLKVITHKKDFCAMLEKVLQEQSEVLKYLENH